MDKSGSDQSDGGPAARLAQGVPGLVGPVVLAQWCVGPAGMSGAQCWAYTLFFCLVKNSFRGLFRVSSEEISLLTLGLHWAYTLSFLLFCPKEEINTQKIANRHSMEGASHGASAEPVQAFMVHPPFFLHALTELESMRQQELDTNSNFPADLVIPLARLLRRAASIVGG